MMHGFKIEKKMESNYRQTSYNIVDGDLMKPDFLVRMGMAERATSREEILKFSKDEDWNVRAAIARNQFTPIDILIDLSKDKDEFVRRNVMKRQEMPEEILAEGAKDVSLTVRRRVLENKNCPQWILPYFLFGDKWSRENALNNYSVQIIDFSI